MKLRKCKYTNYGDEKLGWFHVFGLSTDYGTAAAYEPQMMAIVEDAADHQVYVVRPEDVQFLDEPEEAILDKNKQHRASGG